MPLVPRSLRRPIGLLLENERLYSVDRVLTAVVVWFVSLTIGLFICAMVLVIAGVDKADATDYRLVMFGISSIPAWILATVCLWKRVRGMSLIWHTFTFFGELLV